METFLSIAEIAKKIHGKHIPNFPTAHKNILETAKREMWISRKRKGRGGGLEFALSSLPSLVRLEIERQQANQLLQQIEPQNSGSLNTSKTKKSRAKSKDLPTVHRPEDTQLALDLEDPSTAAKSLNFKQKDCANARMAIVADVLSIGDTLNLSQNQAVAGLGHWQCCGSQCWCFQFVAPMWGNIQIQAVSVR